MSMTPDAFNQYTGQGPVDDKRRRRGRRLRHRGLVRKPAGIRRGSRRRRTSHSRRGL